MAAVPSVSFLQANLDHTRAASSHLIDYIEAQAINVVIVGDPYARSGKLPGLPNSITQLSQATDPKVMVLLQHVQMDIFPVFIAQFVVALRFTSQDFSFLLIAIYAAPSIQIDIILSQISQILLASGDKNVIIAGDFNAKNPLWGGMVTDSRGTEVVQFLAAHNLEVANDPRSIPTFSTSYAQAWIDLTLFSRTIGEYVADWRVSDSVTLCDHRFIQFSLRSRFLPGAKRLTRAGQQRVLASLERDTWFDRIVHSPISNPYTLDLVVEHFYHIYNALYKANTQNAKQYPKAKPWWTDDIARERSWVRSLRRRFQRERDATERLVRRDIYYSALQKYKCHIAKAKDSALRQFCDENTRKFLFSEPFKLAFGKFRSQISIPPLQKPDGCFTSSPEESVSLLLGVHIRQDVVSSDDDDHLRERAVASLPYPDRADDKPFTALEVQAEIQNIKLRSAPGLDSLAPALVRSFYRLHPEFFLFIFNSALRIGHFPTPWKKGRVVFLPKPGRSPELPTSYRPICMNSVFGKILERLLFSRLYYFLVRNDLIHPFQFGFTHLKNTTLALYNLKSVIYDRRQQKLHSVLISLDFQGAFDSVWHPIVLNFLRRHDCPTNLYQLLKSFLSGRMAVCRTRAQEVSVPASIGSPQGSPLSPLLWNILLYGLLDAKFPPGVHIQAYADDTIIVVSGNQRREIEVTASLALEVVSSWARRVKVKLNADKCSYLLFPNGRIAWRGGCRQFVWTEPA